MSIEPRTRGQAIAVLVFLGIVAAGIAWIFLSTSSDSSSASPEPTIDGSGITCSDFRSAMGDLADEVVTLPELREKLKEIEKESILATPAIRAAARSVLRAATVRDDTFLEAAKRMSDTCKATGN